MNRFLTIAILLFTTAIYAQSYRVQYSISNFANDSFNDEQLIVENTNTGQERVLVTNCAGCPSSYSGTTFVNFKPNRVFIRFLFNNTTLGNATINYPGSTNDCTTGNYSLNNQNGLLSPVTLNISPNISIGSTATTPVSSCDTIRFTSRNGFESHVYNWQYTYAGIGWTSIPGFQGISTIDIGIDDLPGVGINTAFQIRLRYCPGRFTNILTYSFSMCSPGLVSLTPSDTSCSYNNDGNIRLVFDRALNTGETLSLNLFMGAPPNDPMAILFTQTGVTLDGANSYTWPSVLEANTYYFRYQSNSDGSIYDSGPFTINAPPAVTFSATWTDVNCFGDNTGSIGITANGGVGNFEYRIDLGVWIPFDNSNSHTISNLSAGNYDIRVRDANMCTEQN